MNSRVAFWGMAVFFIALLGGMLHLTQSFSTPHPTPSVRQTTTLPIPVMAPKAPALPEAAKAECALLRSGGASGLVVEQPSDSPAGDVPLVASEIRSRVKTRTVSDEDGRFTFAALAAGEYRVRVEGDAYIMPSPLAFTVQDCRETRDLCLVVNPAGTISGHVYDTESGAPLSGICVQASRLCLAWTADTDTDGAYAIEGLGPHRYDVSPVHGQNAGIVKPAKPPQKVTAMPGETITGIDFSVSRGLHLAGQVVTRYRAPIAGAKVAARNQSGSCGSVLSKEDGSFTIYGLTASPNPDHELRISAEGYAPGKGGPFNLTKGSQKGIRIILDDEAAIEGTVVNQRGAPVPLAEVHALLAKADGMRIVSDADADLAGRFRIAQLAPGHYELVATPAGRTSARVDEWPATDLTVVAGQHLTDLRLVLDSTGMGNISGRVTDEAGNPLRWASVSAADGSPGLPRSVLTADDGSYTLASLAAKRYQISVKRGGYVRQSRMDVPTGSQNIDFALAERTKIAGVVVDGRTRKPIPRFAVHATRRTTGLYDTYATFTTFSDAEGRFEVAAMGEDATTIFIRADGYALAAETILEIGADEARRITIELEAAMPLHGAVTNRAGAPVADAIILVNQRPSHMPERSARAHSAEDGAFILPDLPRGPHTIYVTHPDYIVASREVDIPHLPTLDVVMEKGGIITGTVMLGDMAFANAHISVQDARAYDRQIGRTTTDSSGHFEVDGLPTAVAIVSCSFKVDGKQRMKQIVAEAATNTVTEVGFSFSAQTATIEGRVVLADGPFDRALIQVLPHSGDNTGSQCMTDAEGYYRITGLEGGPVTVTATRHAAGSRERNIISAELDLTAGETTRHDFRQAGLCTVTCTVAGLPEEFGTVMAYALRGAVDLSGLTDLTALNFRLMRQRRAGFGMVRGDGGAIIFGLLPGDYTIAAIGDPPSDKPLQVTVVPLTITPDQRVCAVDLVF